MGGEFRNKILTSTYNVAAKLPRAENKYSESNLQRS